jgi:hypothetical protein
MGRLNTWGGPIIGAVAAVALIICTVLVTRAFIEVKGTETMIRVTGSARKAIKSDFIIWNGRVSARAESVNDAYAGVKAGIERARAYLVANGVPKEEVFALPITTRTLYAPLPREQSDYMEGGTVYRKIEAYELSQALEVRSTKVDLVDKLSRQVTEIISGGFIFESDAPQYWYTKLGELKVEMLGEAAKDARSRAEQIAANSGCKVGRVRFARMGVMRIVPAYSTSEPNEYGELDTSSLDKEVVAIVTIGYSVR